MSWKIIFTKRAEKDFKSLSQEVRTIMAKAINSKLLLDPNSVLIPLSGKLKGIFKFRVGIYRILCEKKSKIITIVVIKIGHRKEVYDKNFPSHLR